jgi:GMP synthase-like glutamine amidotransferase
MHVLVVGDRGDEDPGHVGQRLLQLGARLTPLDRDDLPAWPDAPRGDLLLLLGSGRSVANPAEAERVDNEAALIGAALADGVPVLGICYGAQILAHALGGTVTVAPQAELGWFTHDSLDETLCPPGPWLQFHGDTFTVPPGARLLGSSAAGPQGMAWEGESATGAPTRALGWQFHPEVTASVLKHWLRVESTFVQRHGDPEQVIADTRRLGDRAQEDAYRLTDAAVSWLRAVRRDDLEATGAR